LACESASDNRQRWAEDGTSVVAKAVKIVRGDSAADYFVEDYAAAAKRISQSSQLWCARVVIAVFAARKSSQIGYTARGAALTRS
jgi:hypothetical protein